MEPEFKTIKAKLTGIGEIEVSILQMGAGWYLIELEKFVTQSDESFFAISRANFDLMLPIHMQRAIQAFIIHLQSGGEKQTCPLIRTHFRNWVKRQNGTLKNIINGQQQSNSTENQSNVRESVQTEFDRRYGGR